MPKTLEELEEWARLLREENHPLADTMEEIAEGWRADLNKECPGPGKCNDPGCPAFYAHESIVKGDQ
jgi:hypothetical protein